jgi:hypothetical protein
VILQWWVNSSGGGRKIIGGSGCRTPPVPGATYNDTVGKATFPKKKPQMEWSFGKSQGEALSFRIDETFAHDDRIRGYHDVKISYDPLPDSFVAEVEASLDTPDPYFVEYVNFYAGGVYDSRPSRKRHQYTIWTHPDGRIIRWPHNPIGYMTPGMNDLDERSVAGGGFIGYFADPYTNPVIEVLHADPSTTCATCCNIYDEHLCHHLQPKEPGVPCHWEARFRLLSVPLEVAKSIERSSTPVRFGVDPAHPDPVYTEPQRTSNDLHASISYNPRLPAFYYGIVSDFEEPVPFDQTVAASCIWASSCPEHEIYWDPYRGHSGTRSIRLRGADAGGSVTATLSAGPSPHIYADKTYRISGWILCEGVTGPGARIRFSEIVFRPRDPGIDHFAGTATGTGDWTYFEQVFTSGPAAELGWLYLELDGPGQAWFDDIALEEV